MRERLVDELKRRFGMDGHGELVKPVLKNDFALWCGIDSISQDIGFIYKLLIDEKSEDFDISMEVNGDYITHCYY